MGFYYNTGDRPPRKESRWKRYIPDWLKRFWADTEEALLVTRVAFSVILPVIGVLFAFVFFCFGALFLLTQCSSGR